MTDHYFSKKQTGMHKKYELEIGVLDMRFTISTGSGMFSPKQLDKGTKLLIEKAQITKGSSVLDLGCGYGVVGIAMIKKYGCTVFFTDINERAVGVTRKNLKNLRLEQKATAMPGDAYEAVGDAQFDIILLNPPQTAGKSVCLKMINEAPEHLVDGGTLQLVARHNVGGKSLSEHMEKVFGNLETVAKGAGFRVYVSRKE